MTSVGIHLLTPSHPFLPKILESIALIHASCILRDRTVASFVPPLSHPKIYEHWDNLVSQTTSGKRIVLICIRPVSRRSSEGQVIEAPFAGHNWPILSHQSSSSNHGSQSSLPEEDLEIAGVVSLSMPDSETGPFRALVQKLFISPHHRRRGVARALVQDLEKRALGLDRWSLMLDTTVGTEAETSQLYEKLGYERLGVVRQYSVSPKDGSLLDEVFFWKDLRNMK